MRSVSSLVGRGASLLGGAVLALGLFWLLAMLVMPPDAKTQQTVETMTLSVTEAPPPRPDNATPAESAPEPAADTPPPAPTPSSVPQSEIKLQDAVTPEAPAEDMALDSQLPELNEALPEPEPEPEPVTEPATNDAGAETSESSQAESSSVEAASTSGDAAGADTPVDAGKVAPTSRVSPNYPSRAQRRGMEGFVEVDFIIRRDGSVVPGSVDIIRARPGQIFNRAARRAIQQWQFETADRRRRATQRIEFQLR